MRAGALAAEAAAAILADQHDVRRVDAEPAGERIECPRDALGRAVEVELAVLPVGHRAARFHRLVAGGLHDERFVDDHRGALEAGIEIAVRPLVGRLAHRQTALRCVWQSPAPSTSAPVPSAGAAGAPSRRRRRRRWRDPHVAVEARVRAAGAQALTGSVTKGSGSRSTTIRSIASAAVRFVDGSQRENRLALIQRLVGERPLGAAQVGQIVGGEDRLDAGHRQRRAGVDARAPARAASG